MCCKDQRRGNKLKIRLLNLDQTMLDVEIQRRRCNCTVRLLPRRRFSCTLYYKIDVETQVNKIVDGLARPRAASDRDEKRKITDLS